MTSPHHTVRLLGLALLLLSAPRVSCTQTLVVAYSGENAVGLVDLARSRVAAVIAVGRGPHEIATSSNGRLAYVANSGGPAARESNTVSVVDVVARRVVRTIDLGECTQPHDLRVSPGDSLLWVTCAPLRTVLEVDAATGRVRRRWDTGVEGGWMLSPTPDGHKVYVANLEGKSVSSIDRARERVRTIARDSAQMGIDVSPDGRELWVASAPASVITVIDTRTDSVIAELPSGARHPIRVKFTPDGAHVLVPHADTTLAILDAASRRLVHLLRLPLVPKVIALSPDGRRAFLSTPGADRVTVVDVAARRVTGTIAVGKTPDGVAWAGSTDSVARAAELGGAAVAQYRGRRYADATETFGRAARLAPHDAPLRYNAALAAAHARRDAEALSWLRRVADLGAAYPLDSVPAFDSLARRADLAPVRARFQRLLAPLVRSEVALTLTQRDLQPESIAYDTATGTFYVGSIYRRKVLRVRGGVVEDFVPEARDGLWGVLGMKLDHQRRELLVNVCNLGDDMPMARPDSATVGRAGLFRFDVATGRLIAKHLVGSDSAGVCFNDLTIASSGDAFISAGSSAVHRFDRAHGTVEPFLASPELMVNGIALSEDGKTLYLANGWWGISAVDVATRMLRTLALPPNATLHWIDGLYVRGNTLIGIQNGLSPERVVAATLSGNGRSIERVDVLESNHPLYADPTTGTIVGDTLFYVATTQLRVFDAQGRMFPRERLKDNVILRLPLPKRP